MGVAIPAVVISMAVGLTTSACAQVVPGTAVADPAGLAAVAEARRPLTAEAALGELTTLDTCSFTSADVFSSAGRVTGPPRPSFDYCTVTVTVGGEKIDVQVGSLVPKDQTPLSSAPSSKKGPRGLRVLGEPGSPAECSMYVGFLDGTDDLLVRVQALPSVSDASTSVNRTILCTLAEVGAEAAMDAIADKKVRHWDLPRNSLGTVDACGLIEAEQVAQFAGPEFAPRLVRVRGTYPAKHLCRWGSTGISEPHVTIYLQVSEPTQGTEETIAGRRTILYSSATSQFTFCALDMPHVPFTLSGSTESEVATVFVWLPAGPSDACAVARNIANTVWPKLPAAS